MRYRAETSVAAGVSETEKVGITVWGKRISPVFDAARTIVLIELAGDAQVGCLQYQIEPGQTAKVIHLLRECGARVLICGAISDEPARRIESSGIRLISFISGRADHVLEWYARGLSIAGYQMPGCHGQGRGRSNHCCRGKRFSPANWLENTTEHQKEVQLCQDVTERDLKGKDL